MPYLFFFSLFLLLILSEPLSITASYQNGVRLYIRLIFFGMIVPLFGHTEKKKQKNRKRNRKARGRARTRTSGSLRGLAFADALRHLIPRTSLILEGVPPPSGIAPLSLGAGYTALATLYATLSSLFFYTEMRVRDSGSGEDTPVRLTLRLCLFDLLVAGVLFASSYIKRKRMSWQKHT